LLVVVAIAISLVIVVVVAADVICGGCGCGGGSGDEFGMRTRAKEPLPWSSAQGDRKKALSLACVTRFSG
jgi:hypothetical protein